jgi:hypothetical protein
MENVVSGLRNGQFEVASITLVAESGDWRMLL